MIGKQRFVVHVDKKCLIIDDMFGKIYKNQVIGGCDIIVITT